jgi:hypothetical protein
MAWGGKADFNGAVVLTEVHERVIARYLPPSLSLQSSAHTRPSYHPLLFIFGEMVQGGAHLLGFSFSAGVSYREVAVLVPFVSHGMESTPAAFSLQMLADHPSAVTLGNTVYGYRKQLVQIEASGPAYQCRHQGRTLFSGTGSVTRASWGPLRLEQSEFAWLHAMIGSPILGQRASGQLVRSSFDWDLTHASVRTLEAEIRWNGLLGSFRARSLLGRALALRNVTWRTGLPQQLPMR